MSHLRDASTWTTFCSTRSTVVAAGADRDFGRIVQQFAGELADVGRHGGGEEQVLPLARQFAHDAADRPDEAEIEHLVDFVENEEFDRARDWRRARRDDRADVPASPPARRGPRASARICAPCGTPPKTTAMSSDRPAERSRKLWAIWLASSRVGREHEHARPAPRRGLLVGDQAVEDRQREGRRLAGAGLGDADQVAPVHQNGNGLRLDRGRLGVAHLGQRGDERRGKAEAVEIFQVMIFQTAAKAREIPRGGLVVVKGDAPRVRATRAIYKQALGRRTRKPFTQPARIGRSIERQPAYP